MANPVVRVRNVSVYYTRTPAITDVCLDVMPGEFLGIIGPNGGGKSTLLKTILGLVPAAEGSVEVFGQPPGGRNNRVGYVPQFTTLDKNFPITLMEVVLSGRIPPRLVPFFRYSSGDKAFALSLLQKVGIEPLADRRIADLSGGEFQKMLIARALAVQPRLLLLDEPTASVDASSRDNIFELLAQLNKDMTIVMVTHDLLAISSRVQRLACLNKRLVYHGEPELNETIVNNLYGCPVDLIAHGVPHRVLKEHGEEETL